MIKTVTEIPEFSNSKEEASWWDEHFADIWEESESVDVKFNLMPPRITVQVTWPIKYAIYREAARRGISVSQLVREWLLERLDLPELGD
jgi:hypothetical protein